MNHLEKQIAEQNYIIDDIKRQFEESPYKGQKYIPFDEAVKRTTLVSEMVKAEMNISKLQDALYNYDPHDDYWVAIELCIDNNITPDEMIQIIQLMVDGKI